MAVTWIWKAALTRQRHHIRRMPIAVLPVTEDFLDRASCPIDGVVSCLQSGKRVLFVSFPHLRYGNAKRAAIQPNCIAKINAPISVIDKNITRIVEHGICSNTVIVDIDRINPALRQSVD